VDTYAFRRDVPEGAKSVEVTFDLVLQPAGTGSLAWHHPHHRQHETRDHSTGTNFSSTRRPRRR